MKSGGPKRRDAQKEGVRLEESYVRCDFHQRITMPRVGLCRYGCGGGSSGWGARSVLFLLVVRVLSAATLLDEAGVLLDFGLGRH